MEKNKPKVVFMYSELIVNEFGLHAMFADKEYAIDGLFLKDSDIVERRSDDIMCNDYDKFIKTKINPYQETDSNNTVIYIKRNS